MFGIFDRTEWRLKTAKPSIFEGLFLANFPKAGIWFTR